MAPSDVEQPIVDRWRTGRLGGLWVIERPLDESGAPGAAGARFVEALDESRRAFEGLLRPWHVSVITPRAAAERDRFRERAWCPDAPHDAFWQGVLDELRGAAAPPVEVAVRFDVRAYACTRRSPREPARAWLRLRDTLTVTAHPDDDVLHLFFMMEHTLFSSIDNAALHALNQPLLEPCLRRWEARLGPIVESHWGESIFRHGYRGPAAG
ncbi:MAG: hypothetical protein U0324_21435 [Polyangiales bacterium]